MPNQHQQNVSRHMNSRLKGSRQEQQPHVDYISHHFDAAYHAKFQASQGLQSPRIYSTSNNPVSSAGMSPFRLTAAWIITIAHIFSFIALYDLFINLSWIQGLRWFLVSGALSYVTGTIGITAGAHRLWAHRSYHAHIVARILIMLMNSVANQASIITWSMEHRIHHIHVDTDADPHNINRGFFYAHMGWLYAPRTDAFIQARKAMKFDDLYNDPVCAIQHRYYFIFGPLFCFVLPCLLGWYFADDAWRGFIYLSMLRWVVCLHATWCVNSVAHTIGPRPYRPDMKASEHPVVAFFTGGEGWHNYHHAFPWDYAASETNALDIAWRFNTARFWIDLLASVGLVWNRKIQRNPYRLPLESSEQQVLVPIHMRDHILEEHEEGDDHSHRDRFISLMKTQTAAATPTTATTACGGSGMHNSSTLIDMDRPIVNAEGLDTPSQLSLSRSTVLSAPESPLLDTLSPDAIITHEEILS